LLIGGVALSEDRNEISLFDGARGAVPLASSVFYPFSWSTEDDACFVVRSAFRAAMDIPSAHLPLQVKMVGIALQPLPGRDLQ
jgi:hypothetical protein